MHRIIIYKGQSQYDLLRRFADQLDSSFKAMGVDSVLVDFEPPDGMPHLDDELKKGCSSIIAFNAIGAEFKIGEDSLYNVLDIPFIGILVDHPYHHYARLNHAINRYVATVIDRSHLRFLEDCFDPDHFRIKSFLPHAGIVHDGYDHRRGTFSARKDRILFAGTYKGRPEKPWHAYKDFLRNLLEDVQDAQHGNWSIEETFDYVCRSRGLIFSNELYKKLKYFAVEQIDSYQTRQNRYSILKILLDAGYGIDVYGSGNWIELDEAYANLKVHGMATLKEIEALSAAYKYTLNDNHNFRNGSHERVFNALANGSFCLSANSSYYEAIFDEDEGGLFYDRDRPEAILERLDGWMADDDKLYASVGKGRRKVLRDHLWMNRARDLLDLIDLSMI